MGGVLCKNGTDVSCRHPSLQIRSQSEFAAGLRSYEASCEEDQDLKSCDVAIHGRINRIVQTLAQGARTRSLPVEAFMDVADGLRETDQDVVKFILEYREDIFGNKEMFHLVEEYLNNSLQTLKFCSDLENCLKRACNSQLMIKLAVKHFEEEMTKGADANYEKTLEELRRFKEAGDPFTDQFNKLFRSVYERQDSMFKKLTKRKNELDKKLKSLETWKKVSNVIFIAAFSSVLIFSVVAAAVVAPPVVIALSAALTAPVASIGKWCNTLWNRYIKEQKEKSRLIVPMVRSSQFSLLDLEDIGLLVCKLEEVIKQLLWNADVGLSEKDALEILMGDMKKRLEMFSEAIDELNKRSARCTLFVTAAREEILKKISTQNGD